MNLARPKTLQTITARLRQCYRSAVPEPIRRVIKDGILGARGPYTKRFFQELDELQDESYSAIAQWLSERFQPTSVLDLGCGTGQLLVAFRKAGVAHCAGTEFTKYAVRHCRQLGLDVVRADLCMLLKI